VANSALRLVAPTNEMQTVRAGRKPNAKLRTREYLTEAKIERLIKATSGNRHGQRDATLLLVIFRHGLRASWRAPRADSVELSRPRHEARGVEPAAPAAASKVS
jgi:integrase